VSVSRPRVTVLYNAPVLPAEHPEADCEVEVAEIVAGALRQQGLEADLLGARLPVGNVLEDLATLAPDVVFNLIEGFDGNPRGETYFAALLDLTGHTYTGSPAEALALCQSKGRTKAVLRGFGLPTAPSAVLALDEPVPGWEGTWPVIVKPEGEEASVGIDQESVVTDAAALRARVELVRSRFGGRVLLEPYLPGPEFNVGVLALAEPEPLPIVQIRFDLVLEPWPILTYDAKWARDWEDEEASPIR
jgi:D-alanine-D-alanine ligase